MTLKNKLAQCIIEGEKGSEHVDWIVSMGIFLVALITIFLLLKPGIQKEGSENFLLDLLEEKFTNDFFLNVKKVPLNIGVCEGYNVEPPKPELIRPKIGLAVGGGWGLSKTEIFYKANDGGIVSSEDKNSETIIDEITCVGVTEANPPCSEYKCHTQGDRDVVYYFTYAQNNPVDFSIQDSSTNDCIIDHCNYRIGAIDNLYGLDTDNVNFKNFKNYLSNPLSQYKVSEIRQRWGFPDNKDFFIKADNKGILEFNYETKKAEERANIHVKTFRTNLINKYGEVTQVVIYFGVW
ncbi:MAG: hypothetical protein AABX29_07700 [Nanoarchaeota archaeon]